MAFEWLLVLFIWFGIRPGGLTLRTLIAGRWPTWRAGFRDMGVAVLFLVVSYSVIGILVYVSRVPQSPGQNPLLPLLPHGRIELAVFCLVALSAGFCEELIFRGYLLRQLSAVTRSRTAGLLLQSIAFGLGHGYQGLARMAIIAVEGCMFGLLARWRQSLRPGMMAHALQDAIAGIAFFGMMK
jgi:membrane protease YdiL (CAAX protease family)